MLKFWSTFHAWNVVHSHMPVPVVLCIVLMWYTLTSASLRAFFSTASLFAFSCSAAHPTLKPPTIHPTTPTDRGNQIMLSWWWANDHGGKLKRSLWIGVGISNHCLNGRGQCVCGGGQEREELSRQHFLSDHDGEGGGQCKSVATSIIRCCYQCVEFCL